MTEDIKYNVNAITVKELAKKIKEGRKISEIKGNVTVELPSSVMVIDGNVTLSEGANIWHMRKK